MSLVLFIRKFPKLGIYVVMFTSILYTFMKFFIIYVLFIIAFGLAFYTLLDDKQVGNYIYSTINVLKNVATIVSLITILFARTSVPQFICTSVIEHKFDLYWKHLDFCDQARVIITPASPQSIGVFCFHVIVLSVRSR